MVDSSRHPVGLVSLSRVKQVPSESRGRRRVDEIACAMDGVAVASPGEPLVNILGRMDECSEGRALVLDGRRLVGIVSPREIHRAIVRAGLRDEVSHDVAEELRPAA